MTLRKKQIPLSYHKLLSIIFWIGLLSLPGQGFAFVPHLDLNVELKTDQSFISVEGNVLLPADRKSITFLLHKDLKITVQGATLTQQSELASKLFGNLFRRYQLSDLAENGKVHFKYQGFLTEKVTFDRSAMPAMIFRPDALYLDGNSAWYPRFLAYPQFTFDLEVNKPDQWEIISQGKPQSLPETVRYNVNKPQDNLYLLGGPFKRYARQYSIDDRKIELEIYLLKPADSIAENYLTLSGKFITHYSKMIGPYPYDKFAVVENQYQTGYGMPSFTLLGSRVIRLPFILYTSLPHEILHNWWGNGVYVDYQKGNWSEGLTAYMADHYFSEKKNTDAEYRRKALEKYANFAAEQRDFPLSAFTSRHNQASQAVGYSKSLMIFHMIRKALGDELFYRNLADFWQKYQFKQASFEHLLRSLTHNSDIGWHSFKQQWIERDGAPSLSLDRAELSTSPQGHQLELQISQTQPGEVYPVSLPVNIGLQASPAQTHWINMNEKQITVTLSLKQQPTSVSVDPDYDVFRLLSQQERPASLSRLFGAKRQILIYPHQATEPQKKAWALLANAWQRRYENVELLADNTIDQLPDDAAVWLLGWENQWLIKQIDRFNTDFQQIIQSKQVLMNQQLFTREQDAVVVLDADTSRSPLGFIGAEQVHAIGGLARKLPHYNSYGALAFNEESMKNIFKQALPVLHSPLKKNLY